MIGERGQLCRIGGHPHGYRCRAPGTHLRALYRVVVEEHHAVKTQLKAAGDTAQVVWLGVPVDAMGGQVRPLQGHRRMGREDFTYIGLFVLAEQAQQATRVTLRHQCALQRRVGRLDPDAVDAIFRDHSRPQGVVAIHGDHLHRGPHQRCIPSRNGGTQGCQRLGSERHVPEAVRRRIQHLPDPISLHGAFTILDENAGNAGQPGDERAKGPGAQVTRAAGGADQHQARDAVSEGSQRIRDFRASRLDQAPVTLHAVGARMTPHQVFPADAHHIGPVAVAPRHALRIEQLLEQLRVSSEVTAGLQPQEIEPVVNHSGNRFQGVGAGQRQQWTGSGHYACCLRQGCNGSTNCGTPAYAGAYAARPASACTACRLGDRTCAHAKVPPHHCSSLCA